MTLETKQTLNMNDLCEQNFATLRLMTYLIFMAEMLS